jgi:hypothetical protein
MEWLSIQNDDRGLYPVTGAGCYEFHRRKIEVSKLGFMSNSQAWKEK